MAEPETARKTGRWRSSVRPDHRLPPGRGPGAERQEERPGIAALLRSLSDDMATLVRQEIRLAKHEAGRTARRLAADGAWISAGAALVAVGGLCLVIAMALGLGALLGSYWLGTLITGGILVGSGAAVAWRGVRDLGAGELAPTGTIETLKDDAEWARGEAREFREEITGG